MMFSITLMAIPIDYDVGLLNSSTVVYMQPEQTVVPTETVITRPMAQVTNECYRQYPVLGKTTVKGVDLGSINRFVLKVKYDLINDSPKIYNGFNFGCVNKLL